MVRINGRQSNRFIVGTNLKQGYILSPLLFNGFITNLANELKELN